jgi:hypothetical protein
MLDSNVLFWMRRDIIKVFCSFFNIFYTISTLHPLEMTIFWNITQCGLMDV